MKIDTYTRFLLTIITLCLVYLSLRDLIQTPRVHADEPLRVLLVDGKDIPVADQYGFRITSLPSSFKVEIEK